MSPSTSANPERVDIHTSATSEFLASANRIDEVSNTTNLPAWLEKYYKSTGIALTPLDPSAPSSPASSGSDRPNHDTTSDHLEESAGEHPPLDQKVEASLTASQLLQAKSQLRVSFKKDTKKELAKMGRGKKASKKKGCEKCLPVNPACLIEKKLREAYAFIAALVKLVPMDITECKELTELWTKWKAHNKLQGEVCVCGAHHDKSMTKRMFMEEWDDMICSFFETAQEVRGFIVDEVPKVKARITEIEEILAAAHELAGARDEGPGGDMSKLAAELESDFYGKELAVLSADLKALQQDRPFMILGDYAPPGAEDILNAAAIAANAQTLSLLDVQLAMANKKLAMAEANHERLEKQAALMEDAPPMWENFSSVRNGLSAKQRCDARAKGLAEDKAAKVKIEQEASRRKWLFMIQAQNADGNGVEDDFQADKMLTVVDKVAIRSGNKSSFELNLLYYAKHKGDPFKELATRIGMEELVKERGLAWTEEVINEKMVVKKVVNKFDKNGNLQHITTAEKAYMESIAALNRKAKELAPKRTAANDRAISKNRAIFTDETPAMSGQINNNMTPFQGMATSMDEFGDQKIREAATSIELIHRGEVAASLVAAMSKEESTSKNETASMSESSMKTFVTYQGNTPSMHMAGSITEAIMKGMATGQVGSTCMDEKAMRKYATSVENAILRDVATGAKGSEILGVFDHSKPIPMLKTLSFDEREATPVHEATDRGMASSISQAVMRDSGAEMIGIPDHRKPNFKTNVQKGSIEILEMPTLASRSTAKEITRQKPGLRSEKQLEALKQLEMQHLLGELAQVKLPRRAEGSEESETNVLLEAAGSAINAMLSRSRANMAKRPPPAETSSLPLWNGESHPC